MKPYYQHSLQYSLIAAICFTLMANLAHASQFFYETEPLAYELPKAISKSCDAQDNCPDISVIYLKSSEKWINQAVNDYINRLIVNAPQQKNLTPHQVTLSLNNFAKQQFDDDSSMMYAFHIEPVYIGHTGEIEQIAIDHYTYLGGAHGVGSRNFLLFNHKTKRPFYLDDMIISGKKPQLRQLLYEQYKNFVTETAQDTLDNYSKIWTFNMTENVVFTQDGLTFVYQPYEIAAYVYGLPELTIPYSQLKGIIKPQYLPSTTSHKPL